MAVSVDDDADARAKNHVLRDLGWQVRRDGDGLIGSAAVVPEMCVPGTSHLRASVLAIWADTVSGLLAIDSIGPRVPVTLELDVHLYRPPPGSGTVVGTASSVKAGRTVQVASVDFTGDDGEAFAFAGASFMAAPDTSMTIPTRTSVDVLLPESTRLTVPFAERAGCERREPGVALLPHSNEALNASNTINGGLIALTAEEAVLSMAPGATLSSLSLRYLQAARVGPVVATAVRRDGLGRVEVRDEGNDNRLCATATVRLFSPAG
jgi:acyl-coenzyme A thioesterase PaaI-like protein